MSGLILYFTPRDCHKSFMLIQAKYMAVSSKFWYSLYRGRNLFKVFFKTVEINFILNVTLNNYNFILISDTVILKVSLVFSIC